MERLLAYEGPVVHVDHGHRAPAPTSFSTREVAEERKECNRHIQKIHDDHKANTAWEKNRIKELQQQLLDKDDALLRERRHKEMAKVKHEEMVKQMVEAEDGRMKAEEDCDHTVAELHNKYTRAAEGDADEMVKLQRALKAQEEELARDRVLIAQLTESERTRSEGIGMYQREALALNDKLEHQAARIRELVEENEALKAQAAAPPKPTPAPKAAPRGPIIPWKAQELIRDIAKYKQRFPDDDMAAIVAEATEKLETGKFTPTEYYTMPGLEQKYYDKASEIREKMNKLQETDVERVDYGAGVVFESTPRLKKLERDYAFVRLGGDLNKLLSEKELLRLNERIETEEKWLKSKKRDLSPDGLLGKLYQRREQLQDGAAQTDDDTKLNSLNPEAIAEAERLMDRWEAEDRQVDAGRGGTTMIAWREQKLYELERPYLYLLYGGEMPVPKNL